MPSRGYISRCWWRRCVSVCNTRDHTGWDWTLPRVIFTSDIKWAHTLKEVELNKTDYPPFVSMVWEATYPDTTKYFLPLPKEEALVNKHSNTLLDCTGSSPSLWPLCVQYVVYLLNRLSTESLQWKTPIIRWQLDIAGTSRTHKFKKPYTDQAMWRRCFVFVKI
jgi:hypothetical protein